MWNKDLSQYIKPIIDLGNDRIIVLDLSILNKRSVYIIAVYLPQRTYVIDNFDQRVDILGCAI
jgi:hypothetical protein